MGRIRILSDNVSNKIAAGEVVERPASVVKELLENSLDAHSSEIQIHIESAGRRLIRVADNGSGMLRDDALLSFERHATSKLSDAKDLLAIATLGFRGEALPSIASISRVLLETRAGEEQTGTGVEITGGKLLRCDEIARPVGTSISVRDLFFNVPARKKFLRSDQTELAHIGSLVTHYSLAHPEKRFELYHEGRELLHVTPVGSRKERAFQVFGSETVNELIDLGNCRSELKLPLPMPAHSSGEPEDQEAAEFCLDGLISGPHIQKLNRNSIFLFVNGRLIRDRLIMHAISSAFHNLMPPACYPFALLFLTCDAAEVDVNVHPAKTEVRFRHASFVHDFVRNAIREKLMESRPVSAMPHPPDSPMPRPVSHSGSDSHPFRGTIGPALPFSEFTQMLDAQPVEPVTEAEDFVHRAADLPQLRITEPYRSSTAIGVVHDLPSPVTARASVRRIPDTHGSLDHLPVEWERVDTLSALPELRPLGQLYESFIIAAGRDGLWIIDQHVAHERILFERVLRQRASGRPELQRLLMPIVLSLSLSQQLDFARIADELNASGFETEPFGQRTIAVKASPAGLPAGDIERAIFEVLETTEAELRSASIEEIRRNIAATIACRSAIKINNKLEQSKMEWLLKTLAECEYPMTCPHGRPIALRYSMKEILKSFHRI